MMPEGRKVKHVTRQQYGSGKVESGGRPTKAARAKGSLGLWRIWVLVGAVLVLVFWLYISFRIDIVDITGARHLASTHLQSVAKESMRGHLLDRNLLTFSSARVRAKMLAKEPLLADASFKRSWPHKVIAAVTEADLGLIWRSAGEGYLTDSNGKIVAKSEPLSAELNIVTINDGANVPVKVGDRVAPARFITFINELGPNVQAKTGLKLKDYSIPESTLEVHVATESGYILKLDTTRTAEEQAEALRVVLSELSRIGKHPAEYIDLRISGKAYYK